MARDTASSGSGTTGPAIGQAPGELALVQGFVNTRDIEQATDELASPAELAGWLGRAGLQGRAYPAGTPGHPGRTSGRRPMAANAADLRLALDLREALRGVLRAHAGHGPAGEPAAELGRVAASLPVRPEVAADGSVRVGTDGDGVRPALARLLLAAAEATSLGTWRRLKVCIADDCQWAFYDRSPTQNACWCSMQVCGSRAKSRAYRQRSAAGARTRNGPATASRSGRTAGPGA
jgi:predicted RNA-binding Zn ribbon-like protein